MFTNRENNTFMNEENNIPHNLQVHFVRQIMVSGLIQAQVALYLLSTSTGWVGQIWLDTRL